MGYDFFWLSLILMPTYVFDWLVRMGAILVVLSLKAEGSCERVEEVVRKSVLVRKEVAVGSKERIFRIPFIENDRQVISRARGLS